MSLPVAASPALSSLSLSVNGKSLQLQLSRPLPQLPTRKIYNPAYFFNETYKHEIANHYRDYKQSTHLPRRRRHTIYVPYRRAAFYGVVSGERRPVLPIAVHNFPGYTAVYTTPRGRQTLCEDAPPDDTYNATVRRIRQANSYKELRVLVERQLKWRECRTSSATNSGRVKLLLNRRQKSAVGKEVFYSRKAENWDTVGENTCEKSPKQQTNNGTDVNVYIANANEKWYDYTADDDDDGSNANGSIKKLKANVLLLSHSKQQDKYKQQSHKKHLFRTQQTLSDTLKSVEVYRKPREELCRTAACTVSTFKARKEQRPQTANHTKIAYPRSEEQFSALNTKEYFLQLACKYYEEGFLRNINYLQTIGTRNAARREQHKLTTKRTSSNSSNDESANATTSSSATNTPRVRSADDFFHLTYLLRRIGRKRSFKLGIRKQDDQTISSEVTTNAESNKNQCHNPCAIRVKIKSNVGRVPAKAKPQSAAKKCTASTLDGCSMNDYLNVNTPTTIIGTTNTSLDYSNANNTVATRAHFHELIDHLMQLEISDIDVSLPKITLTDFSTHVNSVDERAAVGYTTTAATTTTTTQTNDNAFAFEFNSTYNSNNTYNGAYNVLQTPLSKQQIQQVQQQQQYQVQTTALRNGFTLSDTKFGGGGVVHSSLEIPDQIYYNSEARPP